MRPCEAARQEQVAESEVEALLAKPGFQRLVEEWRSIEALPEDEARALLVRLARQLLIEAVALGDVRAGMYVLRAEHRGQDPAVRLVDGLLARARLSPARPPGEAAEPAGAGTSPDPAAASVGRFVAAARSQLVTEHAARTAAAVEREGAEAPKPAPRRPTSPLARRLLRGTALTPALDAVGRDIGQWNASSEPFCVMGRRPPNLTAVRGADVLGWPGSPCYRAQAP